MVRYVDLSVCIPEGISSDLIDLARHTDMTVDDLVAGACDLLYTHPTQSVLRKVLRRSHALKVEKIVANFPKSRRDEDRESDGA